MGPACSPYPSARGLQVDEQCKDGQARAGPKGRREIKLDGAQRKQKAKNRKTGGEFHLRRIAEEEARN